MEVLACSVRGCRADGTEPLEYDGAVLCFVCPQCRARIEADQWEGWRLSPSRRNLLIEHKPAA